MKSRRSVLAGAIALVASPPLVATAQPPATVPRIGFLVPASGIYIGTQPRSLTPSVAGSPISGISKDEPSTMSTARRRTEPGSAIWQPNWFG